jgi:hypothetical protein
MPTTTLVPTKDCNNASAAPGFHNGGGPLGIWDAGKAFCYWDLSGFTPDTVVTSARIILIKNGSTAGNGDISAREIEGPNTWLDAGGSLFAPASTGYVTWLYRIYDTVLWDTAGGDYGADLLAVATITHPPVVGEQIILVGDPLATRLTEYIRQQRPYAGIAFTIETPGLIVAWESREDPAPANRPQLEVTWELSPSTGKLGSRLGGNLRGNTLN